MVFDNNAIVVNYPNRVGDFGRYELPDQREYFSKFEGGSSYIFELALFHVLNGDLLSYTDKCNEVFDDHYQIRFEENTASMNIYHVEKREFNRRIFDIYRYAKSSLAVLGEQSGLTMVRKIAFNRNFDSGSFLLK